MYKYLLFHRVPKGTFFVKSHYSRVEEKEAEKYLENGDAVLYDPKTKKVVKK